MSVYFLLVGLRAVNVREQNVMQFGYDINNIV
jgi:hypothetical protein